MKSQPNPWAWSNTHKPRTTMETQQVGGRQGVIKWFNEVKGFGFIREDNGDEHFVHKSDLSGLVPREGDGVTFDLQPVPGKKDKAVNVNLR